MLSNDESLHEIYVIQSFDTNMEVTRWRISLRAQSGNTATPVNNFVAVVYLKTVQVIIFM